MTFRIEDVGVEQARGRIRQLVRIAQPRVRVRRNGSPESWMPSFIRNTCGYVITAVSAENRISAAARNRLVLTPAGCRSARSTPEARWSRRTRWLGVPGASVRTTLHGFESNPAPSPATSTTTASIGSTYAALHACGCRRALRVFHADHHRGRPGCRPKRRRTMQYSMLTPASRISLSVGASEPGWFEIVVTITSRSMT